MALFLLSIFLYSVPVVLIVYMAAEIYFRNKTNSLNRITALLLLLLSFLIIGLFFAKLLPHEYRLLLTFVFTHIPQFLIMSLALHFFSLLTQCFSAKSRYVILLLCYSPLLAIAVLISQKTWLESEYTQVGYWTYEKSSNLDYSITLVTALYTLVMATYFLYAGLRYVSQKKHLDKKRKQIQFILIGLLSAGAWTVVGIFVPQLYFGEGQLNYPDFGAFGIVIFAAFVRVAMLRYAFLPSFEHKYQILHQLSSLAIVIVDQEDVIHDTNPAARQLFGLKASEIHRSNYNSLLAEPGLQDKAFTGEYRIIQANQEQRLVYAENECLVLDEEFYHYIILKDITESRAAEQKITFLAYNDELTGLLNRVKFHEEVVEALQNLNASNQSSLAVIILDLDRFKMINETKGRHVGNLFLKQAGDFMAGLTSSNLKAARIGSDEFALLLMGKVEDDYLDQLLNVILEHFRLPYIYDNAPYVITASIGVCIVPKHSQNAEDILKYAGIAMNHAKNKGRDRYQIYAKDILHPDWERHAMKIRLRRALEFHEFVLHYQPITDIDTGTIIGVEALIRWDSPELGLVSPAEFIPLAEESGLIIPIGRWVLHQACLDRKSWYEHGFVDLTVSVNISLYQFKNETFIEELKQILQTSQLNPKLLRLEITESTAMENQIHSLALCKELIALGITLSIDDFGTGYSSFSMLKSLIFNEIKIDRYFIEGIVHNPDDVTIVKAIIAMAHGLQMKVVAEGVEDPEQWDILKNMDCDKIQGYYISKALPEETLGMFLTDQKNQPFSEL